MWEILTTHTQECREFFGVSISWLLRILSLKI